MTTAADNALAWLAMMPFSTASPSAIGCGSFSVLICSCRLKSSGATAAMDANFGWLCAQAAWISKAMLTIDSVTQKSSM